MSREYFYGAGKAVPQRSGRPSRPTDARGQPVTGRIVSMLVGQCHGFIRLPDARQVFFHRADLEEGTAFNELEIGDAVVFELLDDTVSGARALRVARRTKSK